LIVLGGQEIAMAVAKSNSGSEPLTQPCNCYKVESLTETILDANQTSNLKDQYVLGEQLGWGQFGVIRVCSDKLTGEVLACKSIAKDRLVTPEDVRSVKLEIEIMTKLSGHPNVVDLKAVYEEENYVHLVMELCAGGELFHQLEKHGRFSESEARVRFRHLMQVILYCHENGVVHRDLKPENILLATKAISSPIKLADFGLATYIKPGIFIFLSFPLQIIDSCFVLISLSSRKF
jgi:serine/threonine protein kinase